MAKLLFTLFYFSYLDLLYKEGVWESVIWQISYITVTYQDVTELCYMMELYDKCGKVVHRPCSSCISSVQNLMETPLSSSCQLRLEVWLSHLRLSCYKRGQRLERDSNAMDVNKRRRRDRMCYVHRK